MIARPLAVNTPPYSTLHTCSKQAPRHSHVSCRGWHCITWYYAIITWRVTCVSITVTAPTETPFHEVPPSCWIPVILNSRKLEVACLSPSLLLLGNDFFCETSVEDTLWIISCSILVVWFNFYNEIFTKFILLMLYWGKLLFEQGATSLRRQFILQAESPLHSRRAHAN